MMRPSMRSCACVAAFAVLLMACGRPDAKVDATSAAGLSGLPHFEGVADDECDTMLMLEVVPRGVGSIDEAVDSADYIVQATVDRVREQTVRSAAKDEGGRVLALADIQIVRVYKGKELPGSVWLASAYLDGDGRTAFAIGDHNLDLVTGGRPLLLFLYARDDGRAEVGSLGPILVEQSRDARLGKCATTHLPAGSDWWAVPETSSQQLLAEVERRVARTDDGPSVVDATKR